MLTRRRWVGAKIETVKGTAETLAAGDAAILGFDPTINQGIQFEDRMPAGMAMGKLASVPNEYIGKAQVKVELRGSGTAGTLPLWASTLLIASGMKDDGTGLLSPISDLADQQTITFAIWEDGKKKFLSGAMCNCTIEGEFGKRCMLTFDITGIWNTPIDEAAPTGITQDTTAPLRVAAATFQIATNAKKIGKFSFDFGNDIQLRADVAQASALAHAYLADRAPTTDFDPEEQLVAADDVFGQWIAGTTSALALSMGSVSGNTVAIAAPRLQYIDPQEADRNKLQTLQIKSQLNADAGDDEFTIQF